MNRLRSKLATAAALLALPAVAAAQGGTPAPDPEADDKNPCTEPTIQGIRCPDLEMKRPFGLYLERAGSRRLLRAGNSIDNIGDGPAALIGRRSSRRYMRARQHIVVKRGRDLKLKTGARLRFSLGHVQRHYWKFHDAAKFELWRLTDDGDRLRRVRRGAKVNYCLRDLRRSNRHLRRSPRRAVYPACSTNFGQRRVTIGTSVGWSDIYPAGYLRQYIDVTGLRGCFVFVHIADPENGIFETSEDNNEAQVVVRLPWKGPGKRGCTGRNTGEVNREFGPY